ncbi:MAG TPA: hypothetical protein VN923_16745 [Thermoanaerobaculia bacterium]|nr:hypothetical protein [Thermoanaerobaculia bacterium]
MASSTIAGSWASGRRACGRRVGWSEKNSAIEEPHQTSNSGTLAAAVSPADKELEDRLRTSRSWTT